MIKKLLFISALLFILTSCEDEKTPEISSNTLALLERSKNSKNKASSVLENIKQRNDFGAARKNRQDFLDEIANEDFVDIKKLSTYFIIQMPYATTDNFLDEKVYPCEQCLVRGDVAKSLLQVQKKLMKKGFRLKIFDCYRPLSIQEKMWNLKPDTSYVANPDKGSNHNRGAAVDLTLTNLQGKELKMGTSFDNFTEKAHHDYENLSDEVVRNRKLLKMTMENAGFSSFDSEWWHYDFKNNTSHPIADFVWTCK